MGRFFGEKPISTAFPQVSHSLTEGLAALRGEVAKLSAQLDRLESQFKLLTSEWDGVYDKLQRQADRIRKRFPIDEAEANSAHKLTADPAEAPSLLPTNGQVDRHKLLAQWQRQRGD